MKPAARLEVAGMRDKVAEIWEEVCVGSQASPLAEYIQTTFTVEDESLRWIRQETARKGLPSIHIQPQEGAFLRFLAAVVGARTCLEVGTLGGYSAAWIAGGMAGDGKLHTVEVNSQHAEAAREHFAHAGLSGRVEVHVGQAIDLLPALAANKPYDLIFLDADKPNYPNYLAWAADHLRPGGVLAAHNAFGYGGKVADESVTELAVQRIRDFNARLAEDGRWTTTIFPAGDGLAVGVLRAAG